VSKRVIPNFRVRRFFAGASDHIRFQLEDGQPAVADAAQGSAVRVPFGAEGGVVFSTVGITLGAHARPMIDGIPQGEDCTMRGKLPRLTHFFE